MIVEIRDQVATLRGDLTKNQEEAIAFAVSMGLRHHPAGMVFDLGDLTQTTSEGVQSFRKATTHLARSAPDARVVLANASANLSRSLRGAGFSGASVMFAPTVAEAKTYLKSESAPAGFPGGEADRESVRAGDAATPVVIAGLLGSDADEHAVAVACRLAGTIPSDAETGDSVARMHLARIMIVPRDRSLAAPVEAEEATVKRLTQFAFAVEEGGCVATVVTQIERTRDGGIRLAEIASNLRAQFLVLALATNASSEDVSMVRYAVERAPCEVIVNRVQLADLQTGDEAVTSGKE
jgi:hypothetical protein